MNLAEKSTARTKAPDRKKDFSLWCAKAKFDIKMNKGLYIIAIPVLLFYLIFHYGTMYGAIIAFKDYNVSKGILGSDWVGFEYFMQFFNSRFFVRLFRNTIMINLYDLIFNFPMPIIFALLINEVRNKVFKRTVQTVTYLPHFISIVVICGMVKEFTSSEGFITAIYAFFGGEQSNLLLKPEMFRGIYVGMNIWINTGWGTIIYLSALTAIDQSLYEAAAIDGAGRWRQTLHVTLPGIAPTIITMLLLKIGKMMELGWQNIILLQNPVTYETSDVISTFVYRKGLYESDYSYASAVGLFNSVINLVLIVASNWLSRKITDQSLW